MRCYNILLLKIGAMLTTALHAVEASFKLLNVLSPIKFLFLTKCDIAEQEKLVLKATRVG